MASPQNLLRGLQTCLLAALLIATSGCAGFDPSKTGFLRDPANETQSAIATLAAATPSPLPPSPTSPPEPTASATPLPTRTPTSSAPVACAASDLLVNVRSDITGNAMVFNVSLTNAGNSPCILSQPPAASLATKQGVALDVDVHPGCSDCIPKAPAPESKATRTALVPTETAIARATGPNQLNLSPNQTADIVFRWTNWCNPFPPGGVALRLDLAAGGLLALPTDAQKAGTCVTPDQRSVLAVSPFFIHP